MVYSIDSVHLDYAHMSPTQFIQIFSSASSVQFLNSVTNLYCSTSFERGDSQLSNDVSHKRICHLYQILSSSTCERKSAFGINTISPIIIDRSTLTILMHKNNDLLCLSHVHLY